MSRFTATAAAAFLLMGLGCEEKKPLPLFRITFTASSDSKPLAGVLVTADGMELGTTSEAGTLQVSIRGRQGSALDVSATCPEGYREPHPLPPLRLRRFQGLDPEATKRGIEMSIECPPRNRRAAVVVRAPGHEDLPVVMRGRELARTDASGVAHLMFELEPGSSFRVEFDTSGHPDLRPQNPGKTMTVHDRDDIFVFDQPFEKKEKPKPRRRRRPPPPPKPSLPVRL